MPASRAEQVRAAYLDWARRATPVSLLLVALIAAEQAAAAAGFWGAPLATGAVRPIGWTVAAAALFVGRGAKRRPLAADPLAAAARVSWTLLACALAPAVVGFVLSFMLRSAMDFYLLLAVSLAGHMMLFPRFELWRAWCAPVEESDAS